MKSQQQLTRYIRRRRFTNLQDRKSILGPFLQFAVYTCLWSIAAIHAFRDPDSCDWSTIDKFPPKQQIPPHVAVFNRLIEIWDSEQGANLLCSSHTAMTKDERLTQLVDGMHGVVMELTAA